LTKPASEVAPDLLGSIVTSTIGGSRVSVVITEVEAYTPDDPASHSHRGMTGANASMFAGPGTLYVYRSYGIHWCMNVVVGQVGEGAAVLLRGGVLIDGHEAAVARRGRPDHICDGPGRLTQALGVTGDEDGIDLLGDDSPVRLESGTRLPYRTTARIGISRAVDVQWRWLATGPVLSTTPEPESHDHD
jgi:DNA-3-methyladenine glycosylase